MVDRFNTSMMLSQKDVITDTRFVELEIKRFKVSQKRIEMLNGERYFKGNHDILLRKRTAIGKGGKNETIDNLPNNRIVDNQYRKLVTQKINYLVGQPIVVRSDNADYNKTLKNFFNKKFMRSIQKLCKDVVNCGIGWLYVYYDDNGNLNFKVVKPYEIIPGWADAEHTVLDYVIRLYEVIAYEGTTEKIIEKVEVYDDNGISYFILENRHLIPDSTPHNNYFSVGGVELNWLKIPFIPFKYNDEISLIRNLKSLQDGLNIILSNFQNNMEEDVRNTIMVIVNYDGTDLGEFRKNLATYGAVKVHSANGVNGDVKTLNVEVNAENYKTIIEIFKKAMIENAMGYDAKDDRLSGSPNQMNIQSMYSDIDLDANGMETEFQASFEELLWFINCHLANSGLGDYENENVEIIFNRDMLINEGEIIDNISKSVDLSEETRLAQHPWVDDIQKELERKRAESADPYSDTFKLESSAVNE